MKDLIPVILTSLLAIGSVCFYMYRLSSKDTEVNSENDETEEKEDTKIKNVKNEKNDRIKTKRNKKYYGTKRRFS